jgi:hypothetical protein
MRAYFRIYDQEILRLESHLPSPSKASKAAGWTISVERIAFITNVANQDNSPGQPKRFLCAATAVRYNYYIQLVVIKRNWVPVANLNLDKAGRAPSCGAAAASLGRSQFSNYHEGSWSYSITTCIPRLLFRGIIRNAFG